MFRATIILVALAALSMASCRTVPAVVVTEGPGVAQYMVKTGTRWALAESSATPEQALKYRTYILEAKTIISDGNAPPTAIDDLNAFLNTKIPNELVRSAINLGAEFIKTNITLPVGDKIPDEYKVWVYAVLDGAAEGCAEYAAAGRGPSSGRVSRSDVTSFR